MAETDGNNTGTSPYLWMLAGCVAFAWMGQFAQLLQLRCDWRLVALARAGLAFAFAAVLARTTGARLVVLGTPMLWMRSLAGSLSLLCTFFAFANLRTSEVLTLTNTFPIWVALLSWPLLHQRPGLGVWAAAACGVGGIVLIQQPQYESGPGARLAVATALIASFTSAVAMLGLNRLAGMAPLAIVAHFSGVATLAVLASWLVAGAPDLLPLANAGTAGLLIGVGASATLGQLCLTRAFTLGQPARVSIIGLSQILFAMGLDLIFGGEMFGPATLAGIGLVLLPTAWVMSSRAE